MSSARLAALLRQRQILTEHLAWLDSEIAAASTASAAATELPAVSENSAPVSPSPQPPPALPDAQPRPDAPVQGTLKQPDPEALARANALADSLIKEYRAQNPNTPESTRRSCLMLTLAMGLFGVAGLMGLYWLYYR